jgi:hypothetical protein
MRRVMAKRGDVRGASAAEEMRVDEKSALRPLEGFKHIEIQDQRRTLTKIDGNDN